MTRIYPTDAATTETAAVADLAFVSVERAQPIAPDGHIVQSFILREGETRQTATYETLLPVPRRPRGTTQVSDLGSFINLVNLHPMNTYPEQGRTVIFADVARHTVTAVLNYDGWRDHTIKLVLSPTPEWLHWRSIDDTLVGQLAFAEHIEDGLSSIASPPAADLLEIAQSFQATRTVKFESGRRLGNGDVNFVYTEETGATAGQKGQLAIPEIFRLNLSVFKGGQLADIPARLRHRATQEGLRIGYKLDRPDEFLEAAFNSVVTDLAERFENIVIASGPAPAAIAAITV